MLQTVSMRKVTPNEIRALRKAKGISRVALAKAVGITPQYMTMLEQGVRKGDVDLLRQIASCLGVTVEVLRADTGAADNVKPLPSSAHPTYQVPIRGYIKAGIADEVVEDAAGTGALGYEWLVEAPGDGVDVFEIYGDSMEPDHHAGDRLICRRVKDPDERPVSGTPVIAEYVPPEGSERDRKCTFKIYFRRNGTEILAPINRERYDLIAMERPRWTIKAIVTEVHSYRHAGRYACLEEEVFGKVTKSPDENVN